MLLSNLLKQNKIFFLTILLSLSGCSPGDIKDNAFGDPSTEATPTLNMPSLIGEWTYYDGPPTNVRPHGMYLNFNFDGTFTGSKYFDYNLKYSIINYSGTWKQKPGSLELTFKFPSCMDGEILSLDIEYVTNGFALKWVGESIPISFVQGSIIDSVKGKNPMPLLSCDYALKDNKSDRMPASVKFR